MKSSTIRRSTLSKESMEVIENLAKEQENDGSLGEYIRPEDAVQEKESDFASKAQEIDLLWQNFKTTQFTSNSPSAYILMGFIAGVVTTLIFAFCLNIYMSKYGSANLFINKPVKEEQTIEQKAQLEQEETDNQAVIPTDEETQVQEEAQQTEQQVESSNENESVQQNIDTSKMKKYKIKSGDTGESIIKHFYGAYTPERAEQIIKVNNLKNLDRINIDQELLIPMP
ncbi:LysM peptidoglycan-binding domain-containing protein [bacterium]|nr:LysM peptidoglycan-binding domain-containing protein [bacterium]